MLSWRGVATVSRLLKIIGFFCKRALEKRRYSAKETCNSKEQTNRSHPIIDIYHDTGWRRLIGSPKLQIIFHKRAIKYRSLLRKMTCKDKGSYGSSPPCNTASPLDVYLYMTYIHSQYISIRMYISMRIHTCMHRLHLHLWTCLYSSIAHVTTTHRVDLTCIYIWRTYIRNKYLWEYIYVREYAHICIIQGGEDS